MGEQNWLLGEGDLERHSLPSEDLAIGFMHVMAYYIIICSPSLVDMQPLVRRLSRN